MSKIAKLGLLSVAPLALVAALAAGPITTADAQACGSYVSTPEHRVSWAIDLALYNPEAKSSAPHVIETVVVKRRSATAVVRFSGPYQSVRRETWRLRSDAKGNWRVTARTLQWKDRSRTVAGR